MKTEFSLAFNEICQERGLSPDTVIDALKTALVSAYRRNVNVSNVQGVDVEIDPRTGEPTILAEKEVVEGVMDDRTEVELVRARAVYPDTQLGDLVMIESTPRNFGRIAAQTAKQVILQRVREAERDKLFDDFASREGEIVNGTVQSITGQNVTIGLGRAEALLPKSQQVNSEKYRAHDKVRVYVLEVRKAARGPQIYVSRNHRNLLRRLLELEVPEIFQGQVEIKSIAREAGQRSKVAVMALQPGVDPVGACVGMRGVRIQSIVRELNDEKIDVIEWDNNQRNFIAKALSPARVSSVFLEEDPDSGKTAVVIVPDDQLSLAIGREGQNARLAAKLTGWRIDIKSLTEAAQDSLDMLTHSAADEAVVNDTVLLGQVRHILEKKSSGRPVTAEDLLVLTRLINGVEGQIIASRAARHEATRKLRLATKKRISEAAWKTELEEFNLKYSIHTLLMTNGYTTVGDVLYQMDLDEMKFLSIGGFGDKALEDLKKAAAAYQQRAKAGLAPTIAELDAQALAAEMAATESSLAAEVKEPVVDGVAVVEATAVSAAPETTPATALVEEDEEDDEEITESEDVFSFPDQAVVPTMPLKPVGRKKVVPVSEESEPKPVVGKIDDLSTPLVAEPQTSKASSKPEPAKKVVVVHTTTATEEVVDEDEQARAKRRKGRELVFDEDAGRVVAKRKRKGSRSRPEWEDYGDGYDEDFL